MKYMGKRLLTLLLAACLLLCCMPCAFAAGSAMSDSEVRALLNSVELHPQRTGYPQVDSLLETILAPYAESDAYTKIRAAYDWIVRNVKYSWAPYSRTSAPAYNCFKPKYNLEYEEGLQEAIPWEIVNRSYHALTVREGICYDYAALFAIMARYIGIDAYVHTGYFKLEPNFGSSTLHHGWTELCIAGKYYIFDPQREYRMSGNGAGTIPYMYFGITAQNAWRYKPDTKDNAARDAGFLPVAAERARFAEITVKATSSGTVSGGGRYKVGDTATVKADGSTEFLGWFGGDGTLLTTDMTYQFTVEQSIKLFAIFSGEYFVDIPAGSWYLEDASEANERGIVNGTELFVFSGEDLLTRAMVVTVLARAVGADGEAEAMPFSDVPAGEWYTGAVAWAKEQNIVNGVGNGRFAPEDAVTREQFVTILMRFVTSGGEVPEPSELPYSDVGDISDFALESVRQAQTIGLLNGYVDGTVRPQGPLTRAEGVALLMRLIRWLETE